MGTSNSYSGPGSVTPLVPTWLEPAEPQTDDSEKSNAPSQDLDTDSDENENTSSETKNDDDLPIIQPEAALNIPPDRFRAARSNFTTYAKSGGDSQKGLRRAVGHYISKGTGGTKNAAKRLGAARTTTAQLANFLSIASTQGSKQALRAFNLQRLVGQSLADIFTGLMEVICPQGGPIDEGIARDAFVEMIAEQTEAGITDFDQLIPQQLQTILESYATHAIVDRIYNDIANKAIILPQHLDELFNIDDQLNDFVRGGVDEAFSGLLEQVSAMSERQLNEQITQVYEQAFRWMQLLAETEEDNT